MSAPNPFDRLTARETSTPIAAVTEADTYYFRSEMELQACIAGEVFPHLEAELFDLDRSTGKWVARESH